MPWTFFKLPITIIKFGSHHGGGGGFWLPEPNWGAPSADPGNPSTGWGVLVLLGCIVIFYLMSWKRKKRKKRSEMPRHGATAGQAEEHAPVALPEDDYVTPVLPPTFRANPADVPVQTLRIAHTLYASPCEECHAVITEPCMLIRGSTPVVVYKDLNWACHMSRIELGAKEHRGLYKALLRDWQGPVPGWLEGIHIATDPGTDRD